MSHDHQSSCSLGLTVKSRHLDLHDHDSEQNLQDFAVPLVPRTAEQFPAHGYLKNNQSIDVKSTTHNKYTVQSRMNMITDLTETNKKRMAAGVGQPAPKMLLPGEVVFSRTVRRSMIAVCLSLQNSKLNSNFELWGGQNSKVKQQHPCERANLLQPEIPGQFPNSQVKQSAIG